MTKRTIKKIRCHLGFHKSNKDYGIHWSTKKVSSSCIHCKSNINHPTMTVKNTPTNDVMTPFQEGLISGSVILLVIVIIVTVCQYG